VLLMPQGGLGLLPIKVQLENMSQPNAEAKLQAILRLLSRPAQVSEMHRRVLLCRQALTLIRRRKDPTIWADLQIQLGNSLAQDPQGRRADNLEQAMQHYQYALEIYSREAFPEQWAMIQNNLAFAYWNRIRGVRADNLEEAVHYYGEALQVFTREAFPEDWAMTQNNLALAYGDRIRGERAGNLEQAIQHYHQALQVYTREAFPEQWALAQNNLALAYRDRIGGKRADNLEKAIRHFEQALEVYTREAFREDWALIQNNLATAYGDRIRGKRADNLEKAIRHFEQALEVYTREALPGDWATTQNNLAAAYSKRIRGSRAENLEQAVRHFEQALEVQTREAFPEQWATTQNNLAAAYSKRIRGARAGNLEQAIQHYQQAFEVYIRETFPKDWALTQNNLATAFSNRIRGGRAENLEQAIQHYEQALEVYTPEAFPEQWAGIQKNLALAYVNRIRGDRADNLEQAIRRFEQALQVRTREAFPEDWAATQKSLATGYGDRIRGERADNLEHAIGHFEQALQVYTREAFPEQWAATQNDLATACRDRIRGEHADNVERAIHYYQQALEVYTGEAFPDHWAATTNNLATAYWNRVRGERAENLEQAIQQYEQALQVFTREAFPEEWAKTQNNLATAYFSRICGERADNLEQAIKHCEQAFQVFTCEAYPELWAAGQNNLGFAYSNRIRGDRANNRERAMHHHAQALQVYTRRALPARHRDTQHSLGELHFDQENWKRAHASYTAAIQVGADLLTEAYTEAGRRAEVGETARLYANDAFALVRLGQLENALLTLEQGKTRLLNEALAMAEADLAMLPDADRKALRVARQAMRDLEAEARLSPDTPARRNDPELAATLRQTRADLKRLVERIRVGQPEFLPAGLDLPGLLALIPQGGALVAPLFTPKGSAVFVVSHGCTTITENNILPLNTFTDADLQALIQGPADDPELGGWLGAYGDQKSNPQRWLDAIEAIGRALWDSLMGPVHQRLTTLGLTEGAPVLLVPQGGLGLLPVHAAWREVNGKKRYFLDDYTVSYAPSGYALSISSRRLGEPQRQQRSVLAVANPTRDLPFTPAEGRAVIALFTNFKSLEEDQATEKMVIAAAPGCNYLHFSCHGFYHWQDAMQSGLVLAGGKPLTVAEIISRLDLSAARLVTLSACETGLTDIRQSPDEYLGLPAGFLQAGTPAVLSTLWPVEDLSTRLLIDQFYRYHLQDRLVPAMALRKAQIWLRDNSAADLALADQWKQVYQTTTDREVERTALWGMHYHAKHAKDKPFSSPYYWAPFTFAGV
jgi:CHAT domain-containing protein/tetratricopeptide (TPR) repeat protein